jgi:hypothetical protein
MSWLDISMVGFVFTVFVAGIALLVKVAIIDEKRS